MNSLLKSVNDFFCFSIKDFISYGNKNPFLGFDNALLEYIKLKNATDLLRGTKLIGKFEFDTVTFEFFFENKILICIKMSSFAMDDINLIKKDLNFGKIYEHDILFKFKDDDFYFLTLDNNVNIYIYDQYISTYGYNIDYSKDIEFQKSLRGLN